VRWGTRWPLVGAGMAAAERACFGRWSASNATMGPRLGAEGLHLVVGRGMGILAVDRGSDLNQHVGILRPRSGQVNASVMVSSFVLDLDGRGCSVPPACSSRRTNDQEMTKRDRIIYWTGSASSMALLIVAPLVVPRIWGAFVTEILIGDCWRCLPDI